MTHDGCLLAFSGYGDRDSSITAIIAANLWNTYHKNGFATLKEDQLQLVLMDCTVKTNILNKNLLWFNMKYKNINGLI